MFTPDPLREFDSETDADERLRQKRIIARKSKRIAELEAQNESLRQRVQDLLKERSTERLAVPDLTLLETQAERRYYSVLYSGVAGSPEAHAAHAEWMEASAARAAQDAQKEKNNGQ